MQKVFVQLRLSLCQRDLVGGLSEGLFETSGFVEVRMVVRSDRFVFVQGNGIGIGFVRGGLVKVLQKEFVRVVRMHLR